MSKPVPKFIAEIYGSAHKFRANKRRLVRQMLKLNSELRRGCAYFPMGEGPVQRIQMDLEILKDRLQTRRWGK